MRDYFRFVWACLKMALRHHRSVLDIASLALGILLPVLSTLYRVYGVSGQEASMNDLAWEIIGGTCVAVVAFRLLISPYWVYQESKNAQLSKIAELNKGIEAWRAMYEPKIMLECGSNVIGSKLDISGGYDFDSSFRVVVRSLGFGPLVNCRGNLIKISTCGRVIFDGQEAKLTFATVGHYPANQQLDAGIPAYLEIFGIKNGIVKVAVNHHERTLGKAQDGEIQKPGQYLVEIVVAVFNSVSVGATLNFDWAGKFETSSLVLVEQHSLASPPVA